MKDAPSIIPAFVLSDSTVTCACGNSLRMVLNIGIAHIISPILLRLMMRIFLICGWVQGYWPDEGSYKILAKICSAAGKSGMVRCSTKAVGFPEYPVNASRADADVLQKTRVCA